MPARAPEAPSSAVIASVDNRVLLRGVSWSDYERLLAIRGDDPAPRMSYLEGDLELMSPSRNHEGIKTCIGRLLEAYAEERGIDIAGFGSWTLRSQPRERGLEPDECYIIGDATGREAPDLAIEVAWTRALLDKLEIYRGLGIGEVWIWRAGAIEVHVLRGERYQPAARSGLFPQLDLEALTRHLESDSQSAAVRAFRAWLRGAG